MEKASKNLIPIFLFIFILFSHSAFSQSTVLEGVPPSIKWYQINTPHFKVLFQDDYLQEAQLTANKLEKLYKPTSNTLNTSPRKISIVLHNKNAFSNGFVRLAPRHSQLFTMPPQDYNFLGTNQWMDLLTSHELRHVVQFQKSKTGLNKVLYYIFGEETQAAMANLAAPAWFWEGDAVGIETALTKSGRGRIPNFGMVFRTNLLERGGWDYSKQHLTSFKHFVPNHYVTGYYLTTHVRRHSDKDIWGRITEYSFSKPFLPNRFSRGLKKEFGYNLDQTYDNMILELDTLWRNQQNIANPKEYQKINLRESQAFTNYKYPQVLNNGEIVVLKRGIGDIERFVKFDDQGKEKTLFTPGLYNDIGQLSVENDIIAWNEYAYDPRWQNVSYSNIKVYDIKNKKNKKITRKGRYSAASLSPDGTKLVSVLTTKQQNYYLVIMETFTGKEIARFATQDNGFFSMPRWIDQDHIVSLVTNDDGKAVISVDWQNKQMKELMPTSDENIGHPVVYDRYLFYNSPISGIDNIYALDLQNGQRYQVTSSKYGAFNPEITNDGKTLVFNDFHKDGMDVATLNIDTAQWTPIAQTKNSSINYFKTWVEQEGDHDLLQDIEVREYPVKRYHRIANVINPYSWGPIFQSDPNDIFVGVSSQDILSTTSISAGYQYDAAESTGRWVGNLSYQGLFPIFDITAESRNRSVERRTNQNQLVTLGWTEQLLKLGVRVPLLLTNSKYNEQLVFNGSTQYTFFRNYTVNDQPLDQPNDQLNVLDYGFNYSRQLKRSKRDIRSQWGQGLSGGFAHTPFNSEFRGTQYNLQAFLLFPGLIKHHSLLLTGGYQYEDSGEGFAFQSSINYPRGYAYQVFENLYTGSVEYAFPLLYPDFHIGSLINFQRFKMNAFYDFGTGINNNINNYFNATGVELSCDLNVFRLLPLLEVGVRYTYIPEFNDYTFGVLLGSFSY